MAGISITGLGIQIVRTNPNHDSLAGLIIGIALLVYGIRLVVTGISGRKGEGAVRSTLS